MNMLRSLSIALILTLLAGCTTTDPYTREEKTSNTAKGAGIGAVIGGVLGAVVNKKDRGKGALIGAAAGGAVGGGIGYYMDQQEAKLRTILEGSGVSVTRRGDIITLNMPGNITFDTNSAYVKGSFHNVLNSVVIVLEEFNKSDLRISGHTDSRGTREYNQTLSEQRAEAVARYLENQRINPARIFTRGHGEDNPIASNSSAYGRNQNRRVEIQIMPPRG